MSDTGSPNLVLGLHKVGAGFPCFIIAEIGVNHEGDYSRCIELIASAKRAGANAVKLQTINAAANYVEGTASFEIFSGSTLTQEETSLAFDYAKEIGLEIFTTVGDIETMDWVVSLKPCAQKISSGLLNHIPLIRYAAKKGLPLLMSTGLSKISEIDLSVNEARNSGAEQIGIFQCTSLYPAPPETLNLSAVRFLGSRYNVVSGFSDHSTGFEYSVLSVAAGATMLEKHFTDDQKRPGYDHAISLDESSFGEMVRRIRDTERVMGVYGRKPVDKVRKNREMYMRCVVALRNIKEGELLTEKNTGIRRPVQGSVGAAPVEIEKMVGKKANNAILKDSGILMQDVR